MAEAAAKSSAVVVPHAPKWHQRAAAWMIYALIQTVTATLRYRWVDRGGFFGGEPPGPAIYCVWHNRLILSMRCYYGYIKRHNRSEGLALMISASKDGGFLSGIFECYQVQPVRGSSSRRGHQALRELTTWAKRDYDLAITPDGPRGPCYVAQDGVISLSQLTGRPIVPVSFNLGWKIRTKSWDRFQIPLPFSRVEMIFGEPIRVPRNASEAEREKFRLELGNGLMGLTRD
jgi:lysophospholipid acyltransferase (LPLAT)-like uncharacterized protein